MKKRFLSREDQILLSEILKKPGEFFICRDGDEISAEMNAEQKRKFRKMKIALAKGLPLAYVLGHKWFYGNKFRVNKHALIPRPETEIMVDAIAETASKRKSVLIADTGTGTGAIIISAAKKLGRARKFEFFASDISAKALELARKNARAISPRKINFAKGNLAEPLIAHLHKKAAGEKAGKKTAGEKIPGKKPFLIIAANLPYLSKQELLEPTIKKEPKLALYGKGKKGFKTIAAFLGRLSKARGFLQAKSSGIAIFLEINYNQAQAAKKIIAKKFPGARLTIKKDLGGFYRLVKIELE